MLGMEIRSDSSKSRRKLMVPRLVLNVAVSAVGLLALFSAVKGYPLALVALFGCVIFLLFGLKPLYDIELAVERIVAAREAADATGVPYSLTARAETFYAGLDDPFAEAVRRANRYREAGADCIFVPGLVGAEAIGGFVREVSAPVSVVMGLVGEPLSVADLGALGVRRISTGASIARSLEARFRGRQQLLEVATNLRFGTYYLRRLYDRMDGHPVLASAAYNAGIHRVRRWRPDREPVPGEIWVENIPFDETRGYVRRILAYTAVYQHRMGLTPTRLSERLQAVTPNAAAKPGG